MGTSGDMAASLFGQDTSMGNELFNQGRSLFGQATNEGAGLAPFYSNEMTNPQGLGATGISQLLTQAGEGVGGAVGSAKRTAMDMGARTGNTAAIPGAIANIAKTGIGDLTSVTNNVALQNALLKQKQQQEGAGGLSALYDSKMGIAGGMDKNALGFQDAADNAINTRLKAQQQGFQRDMAMAKMAAGLATGAMGGIGNMSGDSSFMENVGNFASGFGG